MDVFQLFLGSHSGGSGGFFILLFGARYDIVDPEQQYRCLNRCFVDLQLDGERLPDGAGRRGHVGHLAGDAVHAGRARAARVPRTQRRQSTDRVRAAILSQRARNYLERVCDGAVGRGVRRARGQRLRHGHLGRAAARHQPRRHHQIFSNM